MGATGVGESRPTRGIGWRALASLVILITWIVLFLVYEAFWIGPFTDFQSLVLVIASLLTTLGALVILWAAPRGSPVHRSMSVNGSKSRWPFMGDVQSFLGFTTVAFFSVLLFLAMVLGVAYAASRETTASVMQISSAVLLAVIGFYFGSRRELEKEAEKTKEAKAEALRAREAAAKAQVDQDVVKLLGEANEEHRDGNLAMAMEKYEEALRLEPSEATRADTLFEYVWFLLDLPEPEYLRIPRLVDQAVSLYRRRPYDTDEDVGYLTIAKVVAMANLGRGREAVALANELDDDSKLWKVLFAEESLKPVHLKKLEPLIEQIEKTEVKSFLLKGEWKRAGEQGRLENEQEGPK